ncbi:MAG: thioredoxin family protein [Burkholderiaceae bacterium]|nr:thioredoxin family protein [Burkholderiaceae bacterium]
MPMNHEFAPTEPARADVDAAAGQGPVLVEFGAPWCPHCQRAQPLLEQALAAHPGVRHYKIEDGSGKPLGRSFRVKLWPTLVFMQGGQEVARLVRPTEAGPIAEALASIDPAA